MMLKTTLFAVAAAGTALAQRPVNTTICDYYTTALLKEITPENQLTLLTLIVNTVVIGNYTTPNVGVTVPGILAPGMFNGTAVNLLPYFDGTLASSSRGGMAVSVNFLDGGGAAPIKMNKAANDTKSNQYFLLTHLYQFFGALLGCSKYGMGAFTAYDGVPSMAKAHEFMDLNSAQMNYFITQVALAAASFGVATDDITAVGMALNGAFGLRCAPAATIIPPAGPQLQSICQDASCPISPNATCDAYKVAVAPKNITSNMTATAPGSVGTATVTGSGSPTGSVAPSATSARPGAAPGHVEYSFAAAALGAFAFALL